MTTPRKPKTANQLLRRTRIVLPLSQQPLGFTRHNFLLVTGNRDTNCWVVIKSEGKIG